MVASSIFELVITKFDPSSKVGVERNIFIKKSLKVTYET